MIIKTETTSLRPTSSGSLKAICYEDTKAAKPPIPITSARSPPLSPRETPTSLRPPNASASQQVPLDPVPIPPKLQDNVRRDSGLTSSVTTTPRESRTTLSTDVESATSLRNSPSIPRLSLPDGPASNSATNTRRWGTEEAESPKDGLNAPAMTQVPFMGIVTEIPTGSFEDLTIPGQVDFSKRGSMLIGGKKANNANGSTYKHSRVVGSRRLPSHSLLSPSPSVPSRILSADDEMLSHKVRSMYEGGTDRASDWAVGRFYPRDRSALEGGVVAEGSSLSPSRSNSTQTPDSNYASGYRRPSRTATLGSKRGSMAVLDETELAGGMEDWEDINCDEVDRYGFIVQRKTTLKGPSADSLSPDPPRIQRVSTSLQIASEAPRRQRNSVRRSVSAKSPASSTVAPSAKARRPASSQSSYQGSVNGGQSKFRLVTNRFPQNKDRKVMDEAGDMLTVPPALAGIDEMGEENKAAEGMKKREWEREEKWRKMAKVVNNNRDGGGMTFEFDTRSPKLIERTWKGIPDRWRATAWHAFMTASAKKRPDSPTDETLIATFQKLVIQGSPDDVQIDIDVPRTINSHIMFRRRYRGGQRLLFRVLHCLSIYFPDTGYVQGMAALAATLLCYFDEEMAFVMLVRLWQLRGLERLFEPGFEGLMHALDEFEKVWLGQGELATKLTELNVSPTAYGTRWYLTLFNYSIPFPAQLRVWDVFMLLGDAYPAPPTNSVPEKLQKPPPSPSISTLSNTPPTSTGPKSFNGGLDVLHAASAALVDGTRDILLNSDFENTMKVLTSWIPVKDEELLMRVAKAEWNLHHKKR